MLSKEAIHASAQVKPVSKFLQTHGPGKFAASTKAITAVMSQTLPTFLCATENGGDFAQSKDFPGINTLSRSTEDSAQQTCIVL